MVGAGQPTFRISFTAAFSWTSPKLSQPVVQTASMMFTMFMDQIQQNTSGSKGISCYNYKLTDIDIEVWLGKISGLLARRLERHGILSILESKCRNLRWVSRGNTGRMLDWILHHGGTTDNEVIMTCRKMFFSVPRRGPNIWGNCGDLHLDGSYSVGSGGRYAFPRRARDEVLWIFVDLGFPKQMYT